MTLHPCFKRIRGVAKLFFLVSGENPTLSLSEVKSILSAEGYEYHVLSELTQLLRLEADTRCAEAVRFRSALARACALEIFGCNATLDEILAYAERTDFKPFIESGESFAVRVLRVRGSSPEISCLALERRIGETILKDVKSKGVRVNLENPDKVFLGILTDEKFFFGLRIAEIKHKDLLERGPRRRLFFHPAALTAKMARCMVNLAQARAGEIVLDPFCGTGSILIEAGLIGCRVIGLDVSRRMVEGSQKNLRFFGIEPDGLMVADARAPPLPHGSVKCVVTDPPYGTSSSTFGLTTKDLIEGFFSATSNIIKNEGMVCVAAPKTLGLHEIGEKYGFRHVESHYVYVHRRLTREIAVFKIE
ncbi:MAG: THUMP domain-containing protein [Candidatus Bathyarchaeia archaeon]